jgi:hypothetical protein
LSDDAKKNERPTRLYLSTDDMVSSGLDEATKKTYEESKSNVSGNEWEKKGCHLPGHP